MLFTQVAITKANNLDQFVSSYPAVLIIKLTLQKPNSSILYQLRLALKI